MWNQWYQEQMMLNQMMSTRSARRPHSQGSPGPSQSQGMPGQGRSGPGRNAVGVPGGLQTPHTGQAHQGRAHPSEKTKPAHQEGSDPGARKSSATTKSPQKHTGSTHQSHARIVKNGSQRHVMTDQSMISLLRTTHRRLEAADHDYQGHRVKAMNHIASALADLGSTSVGNLSLPANAGNVPQSRSDEILRDAMFQLRSAETSLGTGTDRAERHHRARSAVGNAVHELVTGHARGSLTCDSGYSIGFNRQRKRACIR